MNVRILLAFTLLSAAACTAQQLSIGGGPPLELDDVEDVPAGAAVGDDASGGYLFTAFSVAHCACREGDEATFGCPLQWEIGADGLWLYQKDGALTATVIRHNELDPTLVLQGGIDADGSFELGAAFDVVDFDSTVGQGYNLAEGTVVPRESIDMSWLVRVQFVDGPDSFDCDLQADFELVYWPADAQGECIADADCHPETPYCVDNVCTTGASGNACTFDSDCATGRCVDDVCQVGDIGEPCDFPSDCASGVCGSEGVCVDVGGCGDLNPCADGRICYHNACQDGVEGDACDGPLDCDVDHACVAGGCYDGSPGDPCQSPVDCDLSQDLTCTPDAVCG